MDTHEHALLDDDDEPDVNRREITNRLIGACIAVHREPGPGYLEAYYERALEIEFRRRGIAYRRQVPFQVTYCGQPIGSGCWDFVVEDKVVLELKHVNAMADVFTATMISYLRATSMRLGLIVNFNVKHPKDGIKRVML